MEFSHRLRAARLLGFLFLAAVLGAVALLIAGYGVAVGLGALVGLMLGGVAGLLSVLWLMRGFGRSVNVAGMEWSSYTYDDQSDERSTVEFATEMHELADLHGIDLGPIRAVRPVLQTVEAGGLSVELVAIEEHQAGLAMTLDVRSGPGALPPASMARVVLADDLGTPYRASAQGQGGWPGRMRYEVTAIPALPATATRLDVRIDRFFDPFPGGRGRGQADGPWAVAVPLEPIQPPDRA